MLFTTCESGASQNGRDMMKYILKCVRKLVVLNMNECHDLDWNNKIALIKKKETRPNYPPGCIDYWL